ncbi:unnamed protein product [Gongylonema pulchrum]|uniref:Transmembrane 9 superfamily member n=1 Tax=Gongylonema pulchrum TaxID=637853 RepID=A0A3P6P1K7_9BILA|nr:unnamed protein product [Gongylonema pulchrum]
MQADRTAAVDLSTKPNHLELFYSVQWMKTETENNNVPYLSFFNDDNYNDSDLIITVKRDLSRYNDSAYGDNFGIEDGWKTVSMDVFRLPKCSNLFAAIIGPPTCVAGVGSQFLFLITLVLIVGSTSLISTRNHETLNSVAVLLYAVTSGIAGFVSAYLYRQFDGGNWITNVNLTTCLFTLPMILIWIMNNSISWAYGSTQALPYTTVVVIALLWLCIGYPLTVVGASIGRNFATSYSAPCRTRNIPRQLPQLPFHKSDFAIMFAGGFLPFRTTLSTKFIIFSAMSMEFYYIFSTIWGRETYTIHYLLLVVLLITVIVVATTSVALIYMKLSAEDYRWWWTSVLVGGCVFFVLFKKKP